MTFAEMIDGFSALAAGGLQAGLVGIGRDAGAAMVHQAQVNATARMEMKTFRLYDSIRSELVAVPGGIELALMAGGDDESAHAVYQEHGWAYTGADGNPAVREGTHYLRDAFDAQLPAIEPALLDFLTAALT